MYTANQNLNWNGPDAVLDPETAARQLVTCELISPSHGPLVFHAPLAIKAMALTKWGELKLETKF